MPAKIFAIANQKGGVGKTTTSINLTFALGELGKKVLLVDIDPQGNSSSGIGLDRRELKLSIYDVLVNSVPITDVILRSSSPNVDIAATNLDLAAAEIELVPMARREFRLKEALDKVKPLYDYIIIDCPPSLGLLTISGLVAAQRLLVPVQCEYYALDGLGQLLSTTEKIAANLNPELAIEGAVLTMFDGRTNLAKEVVNEVRKFFGDKLFNTVIPRNVRLAEAPSFGRSIIEYDAYSLGARAYRVLAQEFLTRQQ